MSDLSLILHRIRVKLYPSHFLNVEGSFIARTNNERTLNVEDICTVMKTRAGFTGKYENLLDYVRQFNDEVAYQLCDGYAVTNGYFTVYPNIGGSFNSVNEAHDHDKHKVTFHFGVRAKLRRLAKDIVVDVEGIADTSGYIDAFTDYEEDAINSVFKPGDQFGISGSKIKVEGDDPGIGLFIVPVSAPSGAVKITRIAENNPSKITGIMPQTGHQYNRIEIRTQFSGINGRPNKTVRTISSSFILEETL